MLLGKGECIVLYHHTEKDVPVKGDVIEIAVLFALPSTDEPGLRIPPVTHHEGNRCLDAGLAGVCVEGEFAQTLYTGHPSGTFHRNS